VHPVPDPLLTKFGIAENRTRDLFIHTYFSFFLFFLQTYITLLLHHAGQEKFSWMTRVYYKDSNGCLILCDLSNKTTVNNAIKWKSDVDSLCAGPGGRKLPCILLANKVCTEGIAITVVTVVIVLVKAIFGDGL
jgi:GTPase SAR1 family protein